MRSPTSASRTFRFKPAQLERIVLIVWAAAVTGVFVRAIVAPHQNTVFTVFLEAGQAWLHGNSLYSQVGKYLYSPLAAAFFSIFARVPEVPGAAVWRALIGGVYVATFILWQRRFGKDLIADFPIGTLLLLPLSLGNLNNGQASLLVIALLLSAALAIEARRWTLGALLIASATFFKIYPLVIGLLFVVIYPWRLGPRLLLSLLALWLLSLVMQKPQYVLQQYREWIGCLGADQRRVSGELGSWRDFWLLLRIVRLPITVPAYAVLQALTGGVIAAFCWWAGHLARWEERRLIWTAFTLGCLWITLFGPSTELATYVFLAPSLAFAGAAMLRWSPSRESISFRVWFAATYLLFIAADAFNAWVPAVRQNNYLHGLQPIAALSFTVLVLVWTFQMERLRSQSGQGCADS
jgi:hypothetical protein